MSINVWDGVANKIILPCLNGVKYKIKQFYIFDGERKIAMFLEGSSKPAWYVYTQNITTGSNSDSSSDN
ncbi:TPA: hypothetical protein ACSJ7Z_003264 [Escherichia coli]|uniref:hypothetical protein n=1 Tax=Escherichia coli TaxID=562 RepID=UPI0010AD68EC|nr:hypothetical protein [Escherichia coli]EHT1099472.1 hypothetical protein [Escherichia coli]EKK4596436.1 hypothetical protein [Escherichia coli]KAE9686810.1 hypothetical protein GP718_07990 [Escherichia coli]MBB7985401.1 hypothetical protein [Escherichia coli]MWQ96509.1 hypothetical protein [Escherichia coli]